MGRKETALKSNQRKVKTWMLVFAGLMGAVLLGAIQKGRDGGDLKWAAAFDRGLEQARQENKPLLLSFHTPGCGWCEKMDAETFTDPKVVALAKQFVCVRLDSDIDPVTTAKYQVDGFPATLFLDAKGQALAPPIPGYIGPKEFAGLLNVVLKMPETNAPAPR